MLGEEAGGGAAMPGVDAGGELRGEEQLARRQRQIEELDALEARENPPWRQPRGKS